MKRKYFISMFFVLNFCSSQYFIKIKNNIPEEKIFENKKINIEVKLNPDVKILRLNFDPELDEQIKKSFIKFFTKKGIKYSKQEYDYKIILKIKTFDIQIQKSPKIETLEGICLGLGIIGAALLFPGILTYLTKDIGFDQPNPNQKKIAYFFLKVSGGLVSLSIIINHIFLRNTDVDYITTLLCELTILKENENVFKKEYKLSSFKKEKYKNSDNPEFISNLLSRVLENFYVKLNNDLIKVLK